MNYKPLKIVITLILLSPTFGISQTATQLKTKSVSIFSNKNAFFIKEGKVETDNGMFLLQNEEVPKARFGTLWFSSAGSELMSITSYVDTISTAIRPKAHNIAELLSINVGKKATLIIGGEYIQGEIKRVEFNEAKPEILYFQTLESKWLTLKASGINQLLFEDEPNYDMPETTNSRLNNRLEVQFKNDKNLQSLTMMYLQGGISWNPFYYLEILTNNKAKVTLRSEVVNDAQDLYNVDLNFVVGTPNFRFSGQLAGLVKLDKQLNPAFENENNSRNRSYGSINMDYELSEIIMETPSSFTNELTGESVEDFYYYPLKGISLAKHSRAHYELFSETVNYENVYECNLIKQIDYDNLYRSSNEPDQNTKVYHSIRIHNQSKNPFAKAPAFLLKSANGNKKALAQDLLEFTPIKAKSMVRITESPEVEVINNEVIIEKDEEGTNLWGRRYYKAKVKGIVKIKNYKNEDINLEIRNRIQGELLSTTLDWEIIWQKVQPSPNELNFVKWNLEMKNGEEKTIEYEFEVYVDR